MHNIPRFDQLTDSKISNFDVSLSIKQDIVKLDISVQNPLLMDVTETFNELLENDFRRDLIQLLSLSNIVKQISTSTELHAK
jgi:hypothetical protein